jgi:AcrR family transcriptional regulator
MMDMRRMSREGGTESDTVRERIIGTATRLFASLGYDGTSAQMIADATGLDVATITDLMGDKRDIYVAVIKHAYMAKRAMYDSAFAEFTPDRAGIHLLADRLLDFSVEHPEVAELWIHRWLGDAADVTGLETLYLKPILDRLIDVTRSAVGTDVDFTVAWWIVIWSVRGFVVGGLLDREGQPVRPSTPELLREFRSHLHQLVDRMLELDR